MGDRVMLTVSGLTDTTRTPAGVDTVGFNSCTPSPNPSTSKSTAMESLFNPCIIGAGPWMVTSIKDGSLDAQFGVKV